MDNASNPSPSRRAAVAVVTSCVAVGLAVGAALAIGSQNLVMGATIGGILALLFGGFAVFATRVSPAGRRSDVADGSAATFGGGHAHGDDDAGFDGGGGGGDAG